LAVRVRSRQIICHTVGMYRSWPYKNDTSPINKIFKKIMARNTADGRNLNTDWRIIDTKDQSFCRWTTINMMLKRYIYQSFILAYTPTYIYSIGIVLFHWLISKDSDWLKSIFIRKLTSQHRFWVSQSFTKSFKEKIISLVLILLTWILETFY